MSTNISRYPSNFKDLGSKGKILTWSFGFFSGIWGDQCIIFRDRGSTDLPGGLANKGNLEFK